MQGVIQWIESGGFVMIPLLVASLAIWAIIFERGWHYWKVSSRLPQFQARILPVLQKGDLQAARIIVAENRDLPSARLMNVALERFHSTDPLQKRNWKEALVRERQRLNQDLRRGLWILGTLGSACPFIGLFGTVVGILKSFKDIAEAGKGGFAIVAAGISEALIATAAGILVAVVAVMAFNAFQTRWAALVMTLRLQSEEWMESLSGREG